MKSRITGGETKLLFKAKILNKYNISYFQCSDTGFIQTEQPFWLQEAYSSAITKLDIGMVQRNETLRDTTLKIISKYFNSETKFLDYAGGYGLFTRLMRDKGYDFYHTDPYCTNLFAEYFDLKDLPINTTFELVTAFEVFEHLPDPINEIKAMLKHSDNLLFTTELVPSTINGIEDWWYFIPETGQHISLFTKKSLAFIAEELGYFFYSDNEQVHLFTKNVLNENPFEVKKLPYFIRTMKRKVERFMIRQLPPRKSFLERDWQMIKHNLNL